MKSTLTKESRLEPLLVPRGGRERKNKVIPIRLSGTSLSYLEAELEKLGLKTPRDRQDFYRGALYAGLANAKRARSKAWQDFIGAIQPLARKHLEMGLELNDAQQIADAGHML